MNQYLSGSLTAGSRAELEILLHNIEALAVVMAQTPDTLDEM
jgi:hypothetical protein